MKNKENVLNDYYKMIINSWTWERLTEDEKTRFTNLLASARIKEALKGTYRARWNILNALYESFLIALEYKPIGWRE